MKAARIAEKDVLKACLDYLNSLPYVVVWRQNSGAFSSTYNDKARFVRFGKKGQADLTGLLNGVRLEVEIKATGKEPTEDQHAWLQFINDNAGVAFWCDSIEMCSSEMKRIFEERGLNWKPEWTI